MTYIPLPYQEEDIVWVAERNRLLANDCGTGKTLIAVEAARLNARGPILVICPRMSKPWWEEVIKEQQGGYVGVCRSAGRGIPWERLVNWDYNRKILPWVIVHHDAVRYAESDIRRVVWDWIIVDESHNFKNKKAQRTKALFHIRGRHKLAMSATPYGNTVADLWAQLHWLYPREYTSYWRFRHKYVNEIKITDPKTGRKFHKVLGRRNVKSLAEELAPIYRKRRKKDVLDVLPTRFNDVPVEIEGRQEELYIQLVKDAYADIEGHEVILESALVKILRLQQCALDPELLLGDEGLAFADYMPAKLEWILEWRKDHPNEPVIIASRFRRFVEDRLHPAVGGAKIVGGMTEEAGREQLRMFKKCNLLVGTIGALKESWNLQHSGIIIITDGSNSVIEESQLAERISRIGQTAHPQVMHLVARLSNSRRKTVDYLLRRAIKSHLSNIELVNEFVRSIQGEF